MKLTWDQALATIIDHTDIGYTQKSQDRIWVIATVDDVSPDEWYGNWLYMIEPGLSSYDLWSDELCFTSLREAKQYIATEVPEKVREYWYPLNLGDEARYENSVINGTEFKPKFAASKPIFDWKFSTLANRPAVLRKAAAR